MDGGVFAPVIAQRRWRVLLPRASCTSLTTSHRAACSYDIHRQANVKRSIHKAEARDDNRHRPIDDEW